MSNSVHFRPDVPPACVFFVGSCLICLGLINLRQFGRTFPGRRWKGGRRQKKKKICRIEKNLCSEHSDLFSHQSCTHRSVICCGTRCGFCCTSGDGHRSVPCTSKADEVAFPQWPKKPLYIPNERRGCELDPCQPDIPLVWARCRCTLLLRSSSIWFGTFLMHLWSKRVNKFTSWCARGGLRKWAADSFTFTSCLRPALVAKLNLADCKRIKMQWTFREFFRVTDCEMKRFNAKLHHLASAGFRCWPIKVSRTVV